MDLRISGQPLHTRSLTVVVRQRRDGRLRARGQVIDLRKGSLIPMIDEMQTAGVIHDMSIDAVVDPASGVLEELETQQPSVAVEASEQTRGQSCRDPAPRLRALVGRRLDDAFAAELGRVFGGPRGCSHLLTLFHLMASALPPALASEAEQIGELGVTRWPGELVFQRSVCLDGFEAAAGRMQLAVLLMDYHSRPRAAAEERLAWLAEQHEVRVLAEVSLADLRIESLRAWERSRSFANLHEAGWAERRSALRGLAGRPIVPGLGRELRERLGSEDRRLRDALVQLAPGFVQCTPALADGLVGRPAAAGRAPPRRCRAS